MPPAAGDGDDDRDPFDDVAAGVDEERTAEEVWREFEATDADPDAVWDRLADHRDGADLRPLASLDRDDATNGHDEGSTNGHDEDDVEFHFPGDAAASREASDDANAEADDEIAALPGDEPDPGRAVGISNLTKILHGYVTAMLIGSALTIYVGTALGALPRHLWVLSLPLLAVAAFLLIPVLAWQLGYWHPARLS